MRKVYAKPTRGVYDLSDFFYLFAIFFGRYTIGSSAIIFFKIFEAFILSFDKLFNLTEPHLWFMFYFFLSVLFAFFSSQLCVKTKTIIKCGEETKFEFKIISCNIFRLLDENWRLFVYVRFQYWNIILANQKFGIFTFLKNN